MPGFTTHYLFGTDVFRSLAAGSLKTLLRREHSAFALGLQGPDLFFYYLPSYLLHRENIGALAHRKDTGRFFANLLASRSLFEGQTQKLAAADAYLCGFIGHYTLDCAIHPYVYAFTGYRAADPPSNLDYFGQHAYFETEIDCALLMQKKHLLPSQFHQNATIRLSPRQRQVIVRMLTYAYQRTFPEVLTSEILLGAAPFWMKLGTHLLNDPSGQKKVLSRLIEKILLGRAFLSPMVASDFHRFIQDPLNLTHRSWMHPWTMQTSSDSFPELYREAAKIYQQRLVSYAGLLRCHFSEPELGNFLSEYGNRSFLSGLDCSHA